MNRYTLILLSIAVSIFTTNVHYSFASEASTDSYERFADIPDLRSAALSPSGERIAFGMIRDGIQHVVVYSILESNYIQVIPIEDMTIREIEFVTDDLMYFSAARSHRSARVRGRYVAGTAWSYNIANDKLKPLITLGENGVHPGQSVGRIIGVTPDNKALMPVYTGNDPARYALLSVDIEEPKRPRTASRGHNSVYDYFVDDQGSVLARVSYDNETNIHSVDTVKDGGGWHTIFEQVAPEPNTTFYAVSPDESYLFAKLWDPENDAYEYRYIDIESGETVYEEWMSKVTSIDRLLRDQNRKLLGLMIDYTTAEYLFLDPQLEAIVTQVTGILGNRERLNLVSWTEDFSSIAFVLESPTQPGLLVTFDAQNGFSALGSSRSRLNESDLSQVIELNYEARDGLLIPNFVTVPRDFTAQSVDYPLVVMPHGGPAAHDSGGFDWLAQAFAHEGFIVMQPQFRGSTGYGKEHLEAGYGEWGGKMQDDVTDGVEFLIRERYVDPERICFVGASYGGYSALMAAIVSPELTSCVVSINGVTNLDDMLDHDRRRFGHDHWIVDYFETKMFKDGATEEALHSRSPYYLAEEINTPVLLIHGEYDLTVPFDQSDDLYDRLRNLDRDVNLVVLEDETHDLENAETRREALVEAVEFVREHIGD